MTKLLNRPFPPKFFPSLLLFPVGWGRICFVGKQSLRLGGNSMGQRWVATLQYALAAIKRRETHTRFANDDQMVEYLKMALRICSDFPIDIKARLRYWIAVYENI